MSDLLSHALILAGQGFPVFPCVSAPGNPKLDKTPACEHGFKDASTDPAVVRELFSRHGADLIGVPTGARSGFDILDLDPRHGSDAWEAENRLPITRIHLTQSGGKHVFFRHAEGVRNSQGKIARGLDVRGEGGFIIWWPASGCEVWLDEDIAPWPEDALAAAIRKPPANPKAEGIRAAVQQPSTADALASLADAVKLIENAVAGERYEVVKSVTWQLSKFILGGFLDEDTARDAVRDAAEAAGGEDMTKVDRLWDGALEKVEPAIVPGSEFDALPPESDEDEPDEPDGWRNMLQRGAPTKKNPDGPVMANLLNASIAFRYAPDWIGRLKFNEFSSQAEIDGRRLEDKDAIRGAIWLQDHHLQIQKATALDAMVEVAHKQPYHPVRDMLRGLDPHDGVARTETWLIDCAGAEDTALTRAYSQKSLIAMVARVMRPGCKVDTMLILEGPQSIKKSTLFRVICGNPTWFSGSPGDPGHKDTFEKLQGKWVIEFAELDHMNRSEVSTIKAFMTQEVDHFRPSYGRLPADYPRQCVFGGTVNPGSTGYLKDETGARRFWPVACGVGKPDHWKIDADWLIANRDQLLAEAVALFDAGEPWWLETAALERQQRTSADERFDAHVWEQPIADYLVGKHVTTIGDLLLNPVGMAVKDQKRFHRVDVGAVLRRLGWTICNVRVAGRQQHSFVSPEYVTTGGRCNVVPIRPAKEPGLADLAG